MSTTDRVWQALAHPVRRRLVELLRDQPRVTGELAGEVAASHGADRFAVQRHLTVLREAGVVLVTARGRERSNALNGSALYQATIGWLRPPDAALAGRLDALKTSAESPKEHVMTLQHFAVIQSIGIEAPPERVFDALVDDTAAWWGAPYSLIDEPETITIDPRLGGLVRESRGGREALWGVVSEFERGAVLAWSGSMGLGPAAHGTVTYTVKEDGTGSRVTVRHESIGPFSDDAAGQYDYGWDDLNHRLKALVETGERYGFGGRNGEVPGFAHT